MCQNCNCVCKEDEQKIWIACPICGEPILKNMIMCEECHRMRR